LRVMAGLFGLSSEDLVWTTTLEWYKQGDQEGVGMEMMRGHSSGGGWNDLKGGGQYSS
jgi:hypothetical protein